ncbi:MAG: dihydrofolate reductase family protein [Halorubrum sp.]|uniref:dihydrofolate reductase family protein n=1 Tax=Halorubrum sp. TaxID=1879286 RepID=UPI003970607B
MHVVVNAAQSVDGKLATRRREQLRISGPEDFDRVDRIRAAADAVLVGVGTVLADDPHLTLDEEDRRVQRLRNGRSGHPARVVVDSRGRTPADARILDDAATTYLLVSAATSEERRAALTGAGAEVVVAGGGGGEIADDEETDGDDEETDGSRVDLAAGFDELADRGVDRLMVEGGGEVIYSCFAAGLVDELHVYVGSMVIGGRDAPTLADGEGFTESFPRLDLVDTERLDDGIVLSYDVRDGET